MGSTSSMFGLGFVIAILVLFMVGDFSLALVAAFILFSGLRVAGH